MPQLPRYDSQRQISAKQPAPFAQGAGDSYKIAQQGLEVASNFLQAWDKAQVTAQLNAFKARKGLFINDLTQQAQLDPDQNAGDKYFDKLKDYKKNALKDMSPRAKQEAMFELDNDVSITGLKLEGIFQKKKIAEAQKNLGITLENLKNQRINTDSKAEAMQAEIEAESLLLMNVENKIISPDHKERLINAWREEVRVDEIERDLYRDPEQFLANTKKNLYEFNDEKEKAKKIDTANQRLRAIENQEKWQRKMAYTEGTLTASQSLLNKTLTPQEVIQLSREGKIDSETASIFYKIATKGVIEIPETTDTTKPDFFLALIDDVGNDKTEAMDILKKAAQSFSRKEMGYNQYAYFIDQAQKKFEAEQKGESWGDKIMGVAYQGLRNSFPPTAIIDIYNYSKKFIDKLQSGKEPKEALQEVKREAVIEKNPSLASSDEPIEEGYRQQAVNILKKRGEVVSDRNIKYIVEQLKNLE